MNKNQACWGTLVRCSGTTVKITLTLRRVWPNRQCLAHSRRSLFVQANSVLEVLRDERVRDLLTLEHTVTAKKAVNSTEANRWPVARKAVDDTARSFVSRTPLCSSRTILRRSWGASLRQRLFFRGRVKFGSLAATSSETTKVCVRRRRS